MSSISTKADGSAGAADYQRARESLDAGDFDGAARWLERAATNEHPAALTELAVLEMHGIGRDDDPARAVELLLRAEAVGGTSETSWLLAQMAIGGVALPMQSARIDAWLADSARRGFPAALRVAGLIFGSQPDDSFQRAAAECLRRAADARDPVGAALFADRVHAGRGIARDVPRALQLCSALRAMGLPVELPAQDPAASQPGRATNAPVEPPWHDLASLMPRTQEVEPRCEHPEVATCDRLLSDEECRYLIYSGARFVERSLVVDPTGKPLEHGVRTSQDMVFVPRADDVGVRILQTRMAALAGAALDHCEPLTLLRYGPGEQYLPHRDYFFPSAPQLAQPGGQRHSTVCVYLNDVAEGGQTTFPDKGVVVQPRRGRAVMFRNLKPDGTPEVNSLHAGLPVVTGEKWLASCWIRMARLRRF